MSRNLSRLWLLAAAFAAASCSMPRTHYYIMDLPHVAPARSAAIARHISIQRFRANRVLSDERILYREGSNEVNFYEYHRWSSLPADLATEYFTHRIKDSGAYARVSAHNEGPGSDLTLRGQLLHFEEVDRGKEVLASVALELELFDTKTRASIWRGEAECVRPVGTRDLAGVVQGVHACLDETSTKLLGAMQAQVEKSGDPMRPK